MECIISESRRNEFGQAISKLPFTIDRDGSVSPQRGQVDMELKCSKPLTYTQLERGVKALARICTEYDVEINTTCGYHVHISNPKFAKKKTLDRITKLWCAIEDVLLSTQPNSRRTNSYCKRLLADIALHGDINFPKEKQALMDRMGDRDRYYALNFASLNRHGTIECRLHSGTVNSKKILNWVQLLGHFYSYAIDSYNTTDVDILLKMPISDDKIAKVFELLELDQDIRAFYLARIEKQGWDTLAAQQKAYNDAQKLRPNVTRLRAIYQRAESQYQTVTSELRAATSAFGSY